MPTALTPSTANWYVAQVVCDGEALFDQESIEAALAIIDAYGDVLVMPVPGEDDYACGCFHLGLAFELDFSFHQYRKAVQTRNGVEVYVLTVDNGNEFAQEVMG